MVVRRAKQLAIALTCVTVLVIAALPLVFEHALRGQLAAIGFTDVHLSVSSIDMKRVVLEDVAIDDVRLGRVEIEPGLGLLWRDPQRVRIPDAIATAPAVTAVGEKASRSRKTTKKSARVELFVSVRDPSPTGWTAKATGTLVLGDKARLDAGHLEVTLPAVRESSLTASGVALSVDAEGSLSPFALTGTGAARAERIDVGPVALADARVPFSFDREGMAFGSGSAALFGGTVTSRPFTLIDSQLVLDAKGLRLDRITGAASPIAATGLVDGQLALNLGSRDALLARGHLRARSAGTLRVRDPKWRAQVAAAGGTGTSAVTQALLSFAYDKLALEMPEGASNTMTLALAGRGTTNHQPLELLVRVNGVQDATRWLQEGP